MGSQRRLAAVMAAAVCATSCGTAAVHGAGGSAPRYPIAPRGPFAAGGDTVEVLTGGRVAFPVIRRLIESARRRIEVEMYELEREDLVAALLRAHRRGLEVSVILDATGRGSAAAALALRASSVDVVAYPVRKEMIDHVKLLVVDGDTAVVGGINWGAASSAHHDFDALVRGPAAANLERVFRRDLVTTGRMLAVPPPLADPDVLVAATLPAPDIRPLVLAAIEQAHRRVDVELYVLTDAGIVHALERAEARGVSVRVLLDPTQRPSDPSAAELRGAGVDVLLYRGHGELLHAKAMVVDDRGVVLGSANWTSGGFSRNHELDIELPDTPAVAAAVRTAMDADWSASSAGPGSSAATGRGEDGAP